MNSAPEGPGMSHWCEQLLGSGGSEEQAWGAYAFAQLPPPPTHPNLPHSCRPHLWELSPGPSDLRFGVFDHYTNMPLGWGVLF